MSSTPSPFTRIPTLKTFQAFIDLTRRLGIEIPCDETVQPSPGSPLGRPVEGVRINGKQIGNRFAIHPMEGWDGTPDGRPTELVLRRWRRFGESGAKLICGGEAMAVRPDGRANPRQLILSKANLQEIAALRQTLLTAHQDLYGSTEDLVIGFQLTHSGRFCRPNDPAVYEPRVAFRHPLLDPRFKVTSDAQVFTDTEIDQLVEDFVRAARLAYEAGADFVDIKHCHGYLLHEFLGAFTRPGKYGGTFENRTRILRRIIEQIRADGNPVEIGVRLSAFDFVPFRPDPSRSSPGKPGPGIPEDYSGCLPYNYGFGVNPGNPVEFDLSEPLEFMRLCSSLGVKILNLSAGSPYYNPHIQRPAAYPPSDGYQPAYDPLIDVARQMAVVREFKSKAPPGLAIVGSAYTYLQDFLPRVAQAAVSGGWTDMVGLGRMVLSYPTLPADVLAGREPSTRLICRTFSDCTTAPRKGLISGCYPLDRHYAELEEAQKLKALKKSN